MKNGTFNILLAAGSLSLCATIALGQQTPPARGIVNITGDLYRAQNGAHFTVFLVTPEGIMLGDPISSDFSNWLKAELSERYDQPVRYVIYSHHHYDHVSGGAVWADTAELIGHANVPANVRAQSGNADFAEVIPPQRTYSDRLTLELGGKTVELIHAPPSHSDDATILYFPAERAVFAVDWFNVARTPYRTMEGEPIDAWIAANNAVQEIDYEIAIPGHGDVGTPADIDEATAYLEDLRDAVAQGIEEGKSLAELQATIDLDEYSHFAQWDAWHTENIQGVYESMTTNR